MSPSAIEIVAAALFGVAVLHTFAASRFQRLAHRYAEGSVGENFFHLLGEVEIVFAFWAGALVLVLVGVEGSTAAIDYMEGRRAGYGLSFTEALFVFVVMTMAATRPILRVADALLSRIARRLPMTPTAAKTVTALVVGPLLGSLITEPAAMTVTALLLREVVFVPKASSKLKHTTLAVLFVNVSIGGTLTHFAAPPVVMVAEPWGWGVRHMILHFGWKAALAVLANTALLAWYNRKEIASLTRAPESASAHPPETDAGPGKIQRIPAWVAAIHVLFLAAVVATSHHTSVFLGIFLFFLGVVAVTDEYQAPLKLREGLLVAAFLGGLVVLGTFQKWWLQTAIVELGPNALFWGATALTAVTDNAALTYLGSLVPSLSDAAKQALVAGAVTGGGLTVIANAPNPVGYGILKEAFGDGGFSPLALAAAAIVPTLIAATLLWLVPL